MNGGPDERVFSSRDVQGMARLSSRQQNDWDTRGALPHERTGDEGWRRFSAREVFALVVCAEMKRKFGVPLERLRFVQNFMLQEGADHLAAAIEMMGSLGLGVWLLTDFDQTFLMDSELEFVDLWKHGYFGGNDGSPSGYVLLKVNPLVNQILANLKKPIRLEAHGRGYEVLLSRMLRPEEEQVLLLIRSGDFDRVEVTTPKGRIETIRTTSHPDAATTVESLLRDEKYQKITVTQRDGSVVSIAQEVTRKAGTVSGV